MRKTVLAIMMFILPALVFAALTPVGNRGMAISAQKGEVQDVSITPIASASHEDVDGIPFYLTADNVAYDAAPDAVTGKRQIAVWSFYSNFANPRITIEAPHLMHSDGTQVPYELAFYYQFKGDSGYVDGNLIVHSGTRYDSATDETCLWNTSGSSVAFTNRPVRFMLAEGVDITSDQYPYGDYRAVVKVTIEGGV